MSVCTEWNSNEINAFSYFNQQRTQRFNWELDKSDMCLLVNFELSKDYKPQVCSVVMIIV